MGPSWENGAEQLGGLFRGPQQGQGNLPEEIP
uniref:Poly(ADP-ribose) polymerase 2 n=1 Tax=Pipistrellus kuhlii TaxID=59472 RepID=A0A7J8B3Z3_PIPKU|nr:poly(ADP-ribose) polymerase 2 [Pipistrellus kuhlii]